MVCFRRAEGTIPVFYAEVKAYEKPKTATRSFIKESEQMAEAMKGETGGEPAGNTEFHPYSGNSTAGGGFTG